MTLSIIGTAGIKMNSMTSSHGIDIIFANMEALASDAETGGQGKECSFARHYTGKSTDIAYECINRGSTICIVHSLCEQDGEPQGHCTNVQ